MESFIYDGVNVIESVEELGGKMYIRSTDGRGVMSRDNTSASVAGVDGTRFIDSIFPPRSITINYVLVGDDYHHIKRIEEQLTRILSKREPANLLFTDQLGQYSAILDSFSPSNTGGRVQEGSFSFYCNDPYRYNMRVDIPVTSLSANVVFNIFNPSNYYTPAIINITLNQAVTGALTINIGGQIMTLNTGSTIPSGTQIVINSEAQEFRVNNVLNVVDVTGDFPLLNSGVTTLSINANTTISGNFAERHI